jgi:hypothetical protein
MTRLKIIASIAVGAFIGITHAESQGAKTSLPRFDPSRPLPLTAKEWLAEKWTDDQRVNNCKVPMNLRGPKPRPDECAKH